MTDEEITERRRHVNRTQTVFGMEWRQTFCYTSGEYADLLAEVERLRAENRELHHRTASQEETLDEAVIDFERLVAENAAMREIVAAVVKQDVDDYDRCTLHTLGCEPVWELVSDQPFQAIWLHAPDCPVTKARALLAVETE